MTFRKGFIPPLTQRATKPMYDVKSPDSLRSPERELREMAFVTGFIPPLTRRATMLDRPSGAQPPILKLPLTWNTALTIAKAIKPTKINTAISTPLAITFVNIFS